MKKYIIITVIGLLIVGAMVFWPKKSITMHPEGEADFVTFINQYKDSSNDGVVIAEGENGDFLTYINATPEILEIYNNKEKTAKFLSMNPDQYIQSGKCIVNTIPYDTIKKMGLGPNDCAWRLFCGSEINPDAYYAVELCGHIVAD